MAIINGTANGDVLTGTLDADSIQGFAGNDTIYGRAGADDLWGGAGSDSLHGGAGDDVLRGDDGDDFLYGEDGHDVLHGGNGNDIMHGGAGTDSLLGNAGNDVLKGGTGLSYLYGGDGDDQLYYDPTTQSIEAVGNYLSGSVLHGDSGNDTLNIFNHATSGAGPTQTWVSVDQDGSGYLAFAALDQSSSIDVGQFDSIERITVSGSGGLNFSGAYDAGSGIDITGTAAADQFSSYYSSDTMRGGGGNDTFYFGGGNDTVISAAGDADQFRFSFFDEGTSTITGFNGAGRQGGDRIYIDDVFITDPDTQVTETNGHTTFRLSGDYYGLPDQHSDLVVDAVGLQAGVDYFIG